MFITDKFQVFIILCTYESHTCMLSPKVDVNLPWNFLNSVK